MSLVNIIAHPIGVAAVATSLLFAPSASPTATVPSETSPETTTLASANSGPTAPTDMSSDYGAAPTEGDGIQLDHADPFIQPALAAFSPGSFSIYYSPNCQNAFRSYSTSGTLSEWWINDTFNSGAGKPGFGKKIAWEGASVFVWGASVNISFQPNVEMKINRTFTSAGGQCFTFKDGVYEDGERNKNYRFTLTKL